jgi:hypothetical protein
VSSLASLYVMVISIPVKTGITFQPTKKALINRKATTHTLKVVLLGKTM